MRLKPGRYIDLRVTVNGDGRMYPLDYVETGVRTHNLWEAGHDTHDIAAMLHVPEAAIYNTLARRRGQLAIVKMRRTV